MSDVKIKILILLLIAVTASCGKSAVKSAEEVKPEIPIEYTEVEFRSFNSEGEKYIGSYVKMKCSFSGPLLDLALIDYPLNRYLPAIVGAPVTPFYAMNPMRRSLGHQNIVIPFEVAEKNPDLENMQNLYLYGKVVSLKIKDISGEVITGIGIEVTKMEPLKGSYQ